MGMLQGSVLSHFLYAVVVDVVSELAGEGVLSELLYADDFVLIGETIEGLRLFPMEGLSMLSFYQLFTVYPMTTLTIISFYQLFTLFV